MKLSFDYKGIKVTYYLTYKKAKAISIKVAADGRVDVIAPRGTSVYAVMDKVKGNALWILNELNNQNNRVSGIQSEENKDAEHITESESKLLEQYMYSGKNYKLEIISNPEAEKIKVKMVRGKFVVETATESVEDIRSAIVEWYKEKVKAKIKERFKAYGDMFEIIPSEIEITDQTNMLIKANRTTLLADAKMGSLPSDVIDYVLVSALARLNTNSKDEELAKIESVISGYQKSQEWLEENKDNLVL